MSEWARVGACPCGFAQLWRRDEEFLLMIENVDPDKPSARYPVGGCGSCGTTKADTISAYRKSLHKEAPECPPEPTPTQ